MEFITGILIFLPIFRKQEFLLLDSEKQPLL